MHYKSDQFDSDAQPSQDIGLEAIAAAADQSGAHLGEHNRSQRHRRGLVLQSWGNRAQVGQGDAMASPGKAVAEHRQGGVQQPQKQISLPQ